MTTQTSGSVSTPSGLGMQNGSYTPPLSHGMLLVFYYHRFLYVECFYYVNCRHNYGSVAKITIFCLFNVSVQSVAKPADISGLRTSRPIPRPPSSQTATYASNANTRVMPAKGYFILFFILYFLLLGSVCCKL